jgi:protein involved in polysaccharide export with SLBB domain
VKKIIALVALAVLAVVATAMVLPPITLGPGDQVTIKRAPEPILVVTATSLSPNPPHQGDHVFFTATMQNQGTATQPAGSSVGFAVDGKNLGYVNDPNPLPAGASVTLTTSWYWVAP